MPITGYCINELVKGSNARSLKSPVVDEERLSPEDDYPELG